MALFPWLLGGGFAGWGAHAAKRSKDRNKRRRKGDEKKALKWAKKKPRELDPLKGSQRKLANKLAENVDIGKLNITRKGLYGEGYDYLKELLSNDHENELNINQQPLYGQGMQYLQDLLSNDSEAVKQFQAPYLSQFNEEIVPSIAERFTQLGEGSQDSSAFRQALAQQAAGLEERLAASRIGLQSQGLQQALGYLQQPVENRFNVRQLQGQGVEQGLNYVQQPVNNRFNRAQLALGAQGRNYYAPQYPNMGPRPPGIGQLLAGGVGQGLGEGLGQAGAFALSGAMSRRGGGGNNVVGQRVNLGGNNNLLGRLPPDFAGGIRGAPRNIPR